MAAVYISSRRKCVRACVRVRVCVAVCTGVCEMCVCVLCGRRALGMA